MNHKINLKLYGGTDRVSETKQKLWEVDDKVFIDYEMGSEKISFPDLFPKFKNAYALALRMFDYSPIAGLNESLRGEDKKTYNAFRRQMLVKLFGVYSQNTKLPDKITVEIDGSFALEIDYREPDFFIDCVFGGDYEAREIFPPSLPKSQGWSNGVRRVKTCEHPGESPV